MSLRSPLTGPAVAAALLTLLFAAAPRAAPEVQVLGLFKDRAVLLIDGRQRMLRAGETSREGVTLVAADSEQATIEIDGVRREQTLGSRIASDYAPPAEPAMARLTRDRDGNFGAAGFINGFAVDFQLDTGASAVVMSGVQAARMGIDFKRVGTLSQAEAASGPVPVFHVVLDRVRVGGVELRGVDGLVLEGEFPSRVLLGMSFVGRLELRQAGGIMELRGRR